MIRGALLALVLVLGIVLLAVPPRPGHSWVHPVAPPLTHVPALAEPTLGPTVGAPPSRGEGLRRAVEAAVRATGSSEQRDEVDRIAREAGALGEVGERARALRVTVEEDAARIAVALGPARVEAILARRDELSTRVGEGRVWTEAAERLRR